MQIQTNNRTRMNKNPFSSFIDLISIDQEIRNTHEQIATIKEEIESYLEQKKELTDRFDQFKQHTHDLQKLVNEKELEMKELDQKEQSKKNQLDQLTNPRDYQPLKKEIDTLKQAQHAAENQLVSIWNKLEVSQKELSVQQEQFDKKLEELHKNILAKQEELQTLTTTLELKQKERPARQDGVPEEWLDKYSHMRLRVADPVVPVLRGSCGACFYNIPDQELLRLNHRALVQCNGCFRLLYSKEAMDKEKESTT